MSERASLFAAVRRWLMSRLNRCDCGHSLTPFADGMECESCLATFEASGV